MFVCSCGSTENSNELKKTSDKENGIKSEIKFSKDFKKVLVHEMKTRSKKGTFQEVNEVLYQLDSMTRDSIYIIKGKFQRIIIAHVIQGKSISYDTDNPPNELNISSNDYKIIKNSLNHEIYIKVNNLYFYFCSKFHKNK